MSSVRNSGAALQATAEVVPIPEGRVAPSWLDVHWEEEGLVPGTSVTVSIQVTADSDYACRIVADGTLIERADLAARGETLTVHDVVLADAQGRASLARRIWEGDVAGSIGERMIQGRARCPAGAELVRTLLTCRHIVVAREGASIVVLGPITHEAFRSPPPPSPEPPAAPEPAGPPARSAAPQSPAPVVVTTPPPTVVITSPVVQPAAPVQAEGADPAPIVGPAATLRVRVVLGDCRGGRCRVTVTVAGGEGRKVRLQRRRNGTYRLYGPRLRVPSSERVRLRLRPGRYRLLLADGTVVRRFVVRDRRVIR